MTNLSKIKRVDRVYFCLQVSLNKLNHSQTYLEKRRKAFADIVTHPPHPKPGVIKDKLEFRNVGGAG